MSINNWRVTKSDGQLLQVIKNVTRFFLHCQNGFMCNRHMKFETSRFLVMS